MIPVLQTRFGRSKKNREQIKIVEIPSRSIKIENGRNEFSIVEEALKTRNLNIGDLRHSSRGSRDYQKELRRI